MINVAASDRLFRDVGQPDICDLIDAVRDSVRAFARGRTAFGDGRSEDRRRWEWTQLVEAGWLGLLASEARGGVGLPPSVMAALYEELGRVGVTERYSAVAVLGLIALEECKPTAVRDRLIEDLVRGSAVPVLCWQSGNNEDENTLCFAPVKTTELGLSIEIKREFVDFIDTATHFCFPVACSGQVGLLVVERGDAKLRIEQTASLSGEAVGNVSFAGPVLFASILELPSDRSLKTAFLLARIAAAAQLSGLVHRVVQLTTEFTTQRVQFGRPVAANQAIQHRLVDMWMQKELALTAVANAGRACASGAKEAELAGLAAKARAGTAADMAVRGAFQLHGAMGYTGEYGLGGLAKACLSLNAWLGRPNGLRRRFVELERTDDGEDR